MNSVPFRSSLRLRLMAYGLVLLLPAIAFLGYGTFAQREHEVARTREDMLRLVRMLRHEHETYIEMTRQLLVTTARNHADKVGNPERCNAALSALLKENPAYQTLTIALPDGNVVCTAQPGGARFNIADRQSFQEAMRARHFILGDYVVSRTTGKPALYMNYPLLDRTGEVVLVASAGLDLNWLSARTKDAGLPPGSTISLIDPDGIVMARSNQPEKWIGKHIEKGAFYEIASTAKAEGSLQSVGTLDGIDRFWAYAPLTQGRPRNAFITAGVPVNIAFTGSHQALLLGIAAITISLSLGIAFAWFGADLVMLRRLRVLIATTQRWASGDTTARTGLASQHDELGQLAAALDHSADAASRQQAQIAEAGRALSVSEANFRTTFELAATGIVVRDMEGRRLEVNQRFCDMLGYSRAELLAMPADGVATEADLRPSQEFIARLMTGEISTYTRDKPLQRKDGSVLMTEVAVSVVNDETGAPLSIISAFTDITERQRAQNEILRLNQQLERRVEERTAELEALTYSVAHDLRAPMRAIDGYAKIVMREHTTGMDAQGHRYLESMSEAARRMGKLLEDLLELMHVGRKELHPAPVDLARLAWKFDRRLREQYSGRELEFTCPQTLTVQADAALAAVAIECLLDNAWKFTACRRQARVEFGVITRDGGQVYFVRDNGAGFDMRYVDKLFGPFQRLHDAKDFPGTGIGLALVARAAKRHGGRAWAESDTGGSSFFFTLTPDLHKTS